MSMTTVARAYAAFSADGSADGYVTVASNTPFVVGAYCYLNSATQTGILVQITALSGATKIGVKKVYSPGNANVDNGVSRAPNYGRSDVSAYLLADSATIIQPPQGIFPGSMDNAWL